MPRKRPDSPEHVSHGVLGAQIRHGAGHRARCMVRHDTGAPVAQASLPNQCLFQSWPSSPVCPLLPAALVVQCRETLALTPHSTRMGAFASLVTFRIDQVDQKSQNKSQTHRDFQLARQVWEVKAADLSISPRHMAALGMQTEGKVCPCFPFLSRIPFLSDSPYFLNSALLSVDHCIAPGPGLFNRQPRR